MKMHLVALPTTQIAAALSDNDNARLDMPIWESNPDVPLNTEDGLMHHAYELNGAIDLEGYHRFADLHLYKAIQLIIIAPVSLITFELTPT